MFVQLLKIALCMELPTNAYIAYISLLHTKLTSNTAEAHFL